MVSSPVLWQSDWSHTFRAKLVSISEQTPGLSIFFHYLFPNGIRASREELPKTEKSSDINTSIVFFIDLVSWKNCHPIHLWNVAGALHRPKAISQVIASVGQRIRMGQEMQYFDGGGGKLFPVISTSGEEKGEKGALFRIAFKKNNVLLLRYHIRRHQFLTYMKIRNSCHRVSLKNESTALRIELE
ncbi:hypothetical protein Tco_0620555 [Tanacetum coccineum]